MAKRVMREVPRGERFKVGDIVRVWTPSLEDQVELELAYNLFTIGNTGLVEGHGELCEVMEVIERDFNDMYNTLPYSVARNNGTSTNYNHTELRKARKWEVKRYNRKKDGKV